jgi:hypothetical protein
LLEAPKANIQRNNSFRFLPFSSHFLNSAPLCCGVFPLPFHFEIHRFLAALMSPAGCKRHVALLRYGCRILSLAEASAKRCGLSRLAPGFGLAAFRPRGEYLKCACERQDGLIDLIDGRCRCSVWVCRLEACWAAIAVRFQGHHSSSQAVLIF